MTRRRLTLLLTGALLLTATACAPEGPDGLPVAETTTAAPSPTRTASPTPTATPTPTPTPTVDPNRYAKSNQLPPEGVAATAEFTGSATGTVVVTVNGASDATLTVQDLSTSAGAYDVRLSQWSRDDDACVDEGSLPIDPAGDGTRQRYLGNAGTEDWTYYREVDITVPADPARPVYDQHGLACENVIVARAVLSWWMTPMRPWLAEDVVDLGPHPGATGEVLSSDEGRPVTYVVAWDDKIADIADRFGITRSELEYLNPTRAAVGNDLGEGQYLNLDVNSRGRVLDPSRL